MSAVLGFAIEEHPAQVTVPELVRAMCKRVENFEEVDAVEQAVRDLVGAGLLHRQGDFISPTRAARIVSRLELEVG